MDIFEAVRGRRSVRDYQDRAPSRDLIAQVIADAVQAPNSMNRQAWRFTVVEGVADLEAISQAAKAFALASAPPDRRAALGPSLESPTFDIFYNAPALVVIWAVQADPMAAQDCCLAAQTLMLSAYARGLGSCWIGFAEGWLNTPEGRRRLGAAETMSRWRRSSSATPGTRRNRREGGTPMSHGSALNRGRLWTDFNLSAPYSRRR